MVGVQCPKCQGTGKVPKPVAHGIMGEADCETCEGTGFIYPETDPEVIRRLDRIIGLLETLASK